MQASATIVWSVTRSLLVDSSQGIAEPAIHTFLDEAKSSSSVGSPPMIEHLAVLLDLTCARGYEVPAFC